MTRTATQGTTTGWMPLAVLATAQFLVVLSRSIVNVALPRIRAGLELSDTSQTWTVNAYVLVFGALLLPGGRAGDVFGLRRVFLLGTGLFAASSAGAALAPTAGVLIASRAAQAIGAALLAPTALALVLTLYPGRDRRGTALGVWGTVSGAPSTRSTRRRILWGGPAHGITGLHEWTFTDDGNSGSVVVRTRESWAGPPVDTDRDNLATALNDSLSNWLQTLKNTAEQSPGLSSPPL